MNNLQPQSFCEILQEVKRCDRKPSQPTLLVRIRQAAASMNLQTIYTDASSCIQEGSVQEVLKVLHFWFEQVIELSDERFANDAAATMALKCCSEVAGSLCESVRDLFVEKQLAQLLRALRAPKRSKWRLVILQGRNLVADAIGLLPKTISAKTSPSMLPLEPRLETESDDRVSPEEPMPVEEIWCRLKAEKFLNLPPNPKALDSKLRRKKISPRLRGKKGGDPSKWYIDEVRTGLSK